VMDQQTISFWSTGKVPAVALSNFDEDAPVAVLEEGAELKSVD
jgi:hypothetical protein